MNKGWSFASKEAILVSDLLDDEWKHELYENIYEMLKGLLNNQRFHKIEPWIERLAFIIHNLSTHLINWRTIGEEEMAIAKVDYRLRMFPSFLKLLLFSSLDLKIHLENNSETLSLLWSVIKFGYLTNFWMNKVATNHSPLMHLVGFKKVYYPRVPPGRAITSPLEKIFVIYFAVKELQNVLNAFRSFKNVFFGRKRAFSNNQMKFLNCPLCLNERNETICTPCGHLFCLECLVEWMKVKSECPMCRTNCPINICVPLLNF
jgi:hypothetical protein